MAQQKINGSQISDTGWVACTYRAGYSGSGTSPPLLVRRMGKTVHLSGGANGTIPTGVYQEVADLPVGFYPPILIRSGAMGSGMHGGGVQVGETGIIMFGHQSGGNRAWMQTEISWLDD